jgi:hypothetical protein
VAKLYREVSGNLYTGDATSLQAQNRPFWVQLTGYDGSKWYSWVEVQPTYGGTFVELVGGRYGFLEAEGADTVYPAYNAANVVVPISTSTVGDPNGSYVLLQRAYFDAGDTTLQWVWVFWWCCGPQQSLVVMTDWQCVDGVVQIIKKRITGQFTVSDP